MHANGLGDAFLGVILAEHAPDGVTLLSGQAAVNRHLASAWSLNRKPLTASGLLPTLSIALAV